MGHQFEGHQEAEVAATPEQVWEAIATGPGIESWFMGRADVEPGDGGTVRLDFGGYAPEQAITAWQPSSRLAYRTDTEADGRFIAYEFLLEGRGQGSTVLRAVTSGFLPGEDWADEYDAMTKGGAMFFRTLVEYLTHFAGRAATPVTAFGPPVADWAHAWTVLRRELKLAGSGPDGQTAVPGDRTRFDLDEHTSIDGVVYFANEQTLGVRTDDALYRFLQGFHGPMIASHHVFSGADDRTADAWQSWLGRVFG